MRLFTPLLLFLAACTASTQPTFVNVPSAYLQIESPPAIDWTGESITNGELATWMIKIDNYAETCYWQLGRINNWQNSQRGKNERP